MAYNPSFKNMIGKNLQLLYADEQVKKVISLAPFVSFRSNRNLKKVFSKVYLTFTGKEF